jgi:hypothetical protein
VEAVSATMIASYAPAEALSISSRDIQPGDGDWDTRHDGMATPLISDILPMA